MESHDSKFIIMKADKMHLDARKQMGEIFAEGFTQWLTFFSKDQNIIAKAFAHMFVLEHFYVAVIDGEIAGVCACTDGQSLSVKLNKKELRAHLGFYKGSLASIFLKREFEAPYENFPENTGSIEFVGTAGKFRGQGTASALIQYIIETTPYDNYLIEEVADNNIPAMKLYEKLGFKEYKRKAMPVSVAKKNGINNIISLEYVKK